MLALVVVFAPSLFGGWLLSRLGPDLGLSAGRVAGPIWSPRLEGLTLQRPGVKAQVGQVGVAVQAFDPLTKTLRLGLQARNATVDLQLKDLFSELESSQGGEGAGGWNVTLGQLDLRNTRVNVDGQGADLPDAQLRVQTAPDGTITVRGRTPQGELSADVTVGTGGAIVADVSADAQAINFYWPGVTSGHITGRYVLGDGPVRGDLKLTSAALRVPEARFVTVTDVAGAVTHRGDQIDLKLAGTGWDGPVTATGQVDLQAQHWSVTAEASPTVSGLAWALDTTGDGTLKLQVTAGGWQTVEVAARAQGAGQLAGIPFRNAQARYTFLQKAQAQTPQHNDLTFSADTELGGSPQKLAGNWTFDRAGEATLAGSFGQKPLDVRAVIDAQNVVRLSGQGLGGPLSGTFDLSSTRLDATVNPRYGAAQAQVALRGTPDDLRAIITDGTAGPFPLSGVARLNSAGFQADLGTVQLDLNRDFRGSWTARSLSGAGLTVSGGGQLDLTGGDVTGTLTAQVPGLAQPLSGPLDVNYLNQRGTFTSGRQQLRWNGDTFPITARGLEVLGGVEVSGDLSVTTTLKAFGTLTARGNGFNVTAQGRGTRASLRGSVGGVSVLADANLREPYTTTARIQGADIQGTLSAADNGVRFSLTTAGQTARGTIDGQDVTARGRVNLAALRPLLQLPGLSGTLDLNLAGQGGSAQVNADVDGASVTGTLTRAAGQVNANLQAGYAGATARLNGQVFPRVDTTGTLTAQGQTLNAVVRGPYDALRAQVTGRTGTLTFSGVTLPAQAVNLRAVLTPQLDVEGTWGDLDVTYSGATNLLRAVGTQALSAFGQTGSVQGRATWGPGPDGTFRGAVAASGELDPYTLALNGPWSDLNVVFTGQGGLRAQGTASLPEGRYDVNVRGPLPNGLFVEGRVQGRGSDPQGQVTLRDANGGAARVALRGLTDFDVQAQGLTVAGQQVVGDLKATAGVLSGTLRAGPLTVNARNGRVSAQGEVAGQRISATGRLTLPATLDDLKLDVSGPYFTATARGTADTLRGQVTLQPQTLGEAPLTLSVPQQSFPLSASLTGTRATVGGLTYAGGRWSGALDARYAVSGTAGTVRLTGADQTLTAQPSGPLGGRVQLWPQVGGTLTASLAPAAALLPDALRAEVVPGVLVADLTNTGAALSMRGSRYLGEALSLDARVLWQGRVSASGTLDHPSFRLPVVYDGQTLTVRGAALDARALGPLLSGSLADLTGRATLDLSVPGLDPAQASGRAQLDLRAGGQRAAGRVTLSRGQLGADLNSTLAGMNLRVRGPLYPRADATLTLDDLRATLTGRASDTLSLSASGSYAGRPVTLNATGTALTGRAAAAQLDATAAGAAVNVTLNRGAGTGLAAWQVAGRASVPDLSAVLNAGASGSVTAAIDGTLAEIRLDTSGTVAGVRFQAPASFADGVLRLQNASATLPQGTLRASGPVFPELKLSARATVTDVLPGEYTAQVGGSFARPDVQVQGVLTDGKRGLQAGGSRLSARLFGPDWKVGLSGEKLAGSARGQLGANALGGLLTSTLTLHTRFLGGAAEAPYSVRLDGTPGWKTRGGFSGTLRVVGDVPGGPLDAVLDGAGDLKVAALVGTGAQQARVTGTLPAGLPFAPGGQVTLQAFDVAALWGRPGQLQVTGAATLGGASWSALQADFAGQLEDRGGELGGELRASYGAGNADVGLQGPAVTGRGTLTDGRYALTLKANTLRVARLLPRGLEVDALTFAGRVALAGTLAGGPEQLNVQNVALKGQQAQTGPFSVYGNATYLRQRGQPDALQADLSGSLRGGVLRAQGQLPQGVRVTVSGLGTAGLAPALGQGTLGADLTLRGAVADPVFSGSVTARTTAVDALVTLSGRARDPRAQLRAQLLGAAGGTLYADAQDLDLTAGTVRTRVYGTVRSGGTAATVDLRGMWPQLAGSVRATLAGLDTPVTLSGDGRGGYLLDGGALGTGRLSLSGGQGFVPRLTGTATVTPLPLVNGTGELTIAATLAGDLTAPSVAASVTSRGATAYGVTLADTRGQLGGTLGTLNGTLSQAGQPVAALNGTQIDLSGLRLDAAGSTVRVGGAANLGGTADLSLAASGTLDGTVRARYRARSLALSGQLAGPQQLAAALDLRADALTGWHGGVRVTGGPALGGSGDVLTAPGVLNVSGPLAHPLLRGTAGLLGAEARIVAAPTGVQLRLTDGPGATASGAVGVRPGPAGDWAWSGAVSLTRPELSLSVTPSGPLADPQLLLSVRRGEWRASGAATLDSADLRVSDGEKDGTLRWQAGELSASLPGLQLARLNIPGVNGVLNASGTLRTDTQNGQLTLRVTDLASPYEVPYLGVALSGDASADVTLRGGRPSVQGEVRLAAGTLQLSAAQGQQSWSGRVSGSLRREAGVLNLDVGADGRGLTGTVQAQDYPLDLAGQSLKVAGTVTLAEQTFAASLTARNAMGGVSADASGSLGDLLPGAADALALTPTGEGYRVRAVLDDLEVRNLKVAPDLSGRISGEANLRDGGGTFVLRSAALQVGPRTLPARLEGTLVDGSWRIRGFLGESDFTAGLNTTGPGSGEVFGQGTLRALPIGALLGAYTGTTPGEGVVTGVARFRFPLSDPPAGNATVVAERIRVSATSGEGSAAVTEVLTGSGTLDYAQRELRTMNIQLSGAGTWDVRGQYTRERVDLTAQFTNTTFTPVLRLIPGLAELNPSLRGSLTLSAAGTYDRPRAGLRVQNVTGSVAGLSLEIPTFTGDLPDSGAFTARGRVLTGGTVGTNGTLELSGQLTLGKLSATRLAFSGLLAPQGLGALPGTTATLIQTGDVWTLDAQSRSTNPTSGAGTLRLSGQLSPTWDLTLTARNYNLPLTVIYGRESALNADLRAVDDGTVIRVSGAADFARLTLGRADASAATIPMPGQSNGQPLNGDPSGSGRTTDSYVSPLPEIYTTFPPPPSAQASGETDGAAPRPARPLLDRLIFENVPIRAPGGIRIDENLVRAEFSGGLVLSGSGSQPRLTGEVRSQRGFIYLRENEFTLADSTVTFGGDGLFPAFNITANGQVQAVTTRQRVPVTVNLRGEFVTRADGQAALNLNTTLRCTAEGNACRDPDTAQNYSEPELYALVATGVPNLNALPGNLGALGSSALQTALNVFVLGEVERTIANAFGLDVFRLTPRLSAEDGSLGATLTFGSYLTRDLYLQYQVDLNGKGLLDATYSTPDDRFTFRVSTPLSGLDLESLRPSFSAGYNINPRTNLSIGVQNTDTSTRLRLGVTYRIGGK
ncbi:hypothetical protein GCM10010841_21590 [Deinococcus aerophilus]|uniref:Translocation and assembly module TamB C-terminal domain-containing protein n=1 Tax=Deinococcus aerophilus TaxID=522488 RepID=A0ABQ2GUI4_9DEIO|nr:hypothetical protein GCM10010841_21590 [Deinococcus aerophilus]